MTATIRGFITDVQNSVTERCKFYKKQPREAIGRTFDAARAAVGAKVSYELAKSAMYGAYALAKAHVECSHVNAESSLIKIASCRHVIPLLNVSHRFAVNCSSDNLLANVAGVTMLVLGGAYVGSKALQYAKHAWYIPHPPENAKKGK